MKRLKRLFLARAAMTLLAVLLGSQTGAWATILGSGSATDPFIIHDADDWAAFAANVNGGTTYENQYVKLSDDFDNSSNAVTAKVGTVNDNSQVNPFKGIFDGNSRTLYVNITDNDNQGTAPFCYINGATIKNLTVEGSVSSQKEHAAGLVGFSKDANNHIEDCIVRATVNGGTHVGGILGHGLSSVVAIERCVFSGTITGGGTAKGVIFGWGDDGGTKSITDCLYVMQSGQNTLNLDLVKLHGGSVTVTRCYKTTSAGTYGTQVFTTASADEISKQLTLADGNTYYIPCTFSGLQSNYLPTGSAIALSYTVTDASGTELTKDTHYNEELQRDGATVTEVKELGTYTLTITAVSGSGYTGSKSVTFTVSNVAEIGDGTNTTNIAPLYGNYKSSYVQMIYTASQLQTAGISGPCLINKLGFNSSSANNYTRKPVIYICHAPDGKSTFSGNTDFVSINEFTKVYDYANHSEWSITAGWNEFELDTPFEYDGTSNLIVAVHCGLINSFAGTSFYYATTESDQVIYAYHDNTDPVPATYEGNWGNYSGSKYTSKNLPNLKLYYDPLTGDCAYPTDLAVSNITATSADVSWTSDAITWQICLSGNEDNPATVSTTNYTLTGLTELTSYTVKVRTVCSEGGYSAWMSKTFTTPPTCPAPTNLAVSSIFATAAELNWVENGTATEWEICLNDDEDNLITADSHPFTLDDLTVSTPYTAKVRAVNSQNEKSSWSNTITFRTTAVATPVGDSWSDGFEGDACGWQLINGTCANQWVWGGAANNGGTKALYISNDEGTNNAYTLNSSTMVYATKLLTFSEGKYEFSYDWKANGESTWDYLRVALVPATVTLEAGTNTLSDFGYNKLPADWIALDGGSKLNLVTEWQTKSVAINVAAGNYYLVMAWRNDTSGGNQTPAAIDNVSISRFTCGYDVDGLGVTSITTTSATLTWTIGEATQWQVAYSDKASFEGARTAIVEEATYSISGLQPNTHYYARVRAYCGGEDYGAWSEVLQFNTDCEAITTFPWTENFDSYTAAAGVLPMCWSRINTTTNSSYTSYPRIYSSSSTPSTPNCLYFSSYYSSFSNYDPQPQYAILPAMEDLNGKMITLQAKSGYSNRSFKIGLMTDPGDATTFTEIAEQALTTSFQEFEYYIPADATASYVAIMIEAANEGRTSNYVYIDDITIKEAPACIRPTGLAASNPTAHGATLSWRVNDETQTTWEVQMATDNEFPDGEVQLIQNINNHEGYELSGLAPETTYYVRVRANCGDGDVSEWSNTASFKTTIACPAPTSLAVTPRNKSAELSWNGTSDSYKVSYRTAAYVDGFAEEFNNSGVPSGWTSYSGLVDDVLNGTATLSTYSSWTTTDKALGQYNMKLNIYGTSRKYWLVTPEFKLSGGGMSFDLALTKYNSADPIADNTQQADDRFVVLIYADDAWHVLREWNNSDSEYVYNNIPNTGENVTIDLSAYNGKNVKIAFYGESTESNGDNDLHIDNVICGTLHPAGEWQTVTVEEATATISGLTPETLYDVKVQGDCGELDGLSLETNLTFTTLEACPAPTDLAVSNITTNSATLRWTENNDDEVTSWVVANKTAGEENFTEVTVNSNPFTLEGLAPETAYTAKVRAVGSEGTSEWSAAISFTTLSYSAAPYELSTTDIAVNSASLNWNGVQESYNVRYRKTSVATDNQLFFEDFEDTDLSNWTFISNNTENNIESGEAGCIGDAKHSGDYGFRFSSWSSANDYNQYLVSDALELNGAGELQFYYKKYGNYEETFAVGYSSTPNDWDAFTWTDLNLTTAWQEYTLNLPADVKYIAFHYYSNYQYYVYLDDITIYEAEWEVKNDVTSPLAIDELEEGTKYAWQVQGINEGEPTEWSETSNFTTLSSITLANDDSGATERNSAIIDANNGKKAQVTLADRTLYKDGAWNTLCLPFNLVLEGSPLEDAEARTLDEASIDGTTLILNFSNPVSELKAGTPYIIKWDSGSDIVNPVFNGVTIDKTMNDKAFAGVLTFKGNYNYQSFDAEDKSILFMDGGNTLNWPKNGATIGACRAYFQLADGITAGSVNNARLFFGSDDTQGIISIDNGQLTIDNESGSWYTVNGVKVEKPKRKGLYIQNGRKVVIK